MTYLIVLAIGIYIGWLMFARKSDYSGPRPILPTDALVVTLLTEER